MVSLELQVFAAGRHVPSCNNIVSCSRRASRPAHQPWWPLDRSKIVCVLLLWPCNTREIVRVHRPTMPPVYYLTITRRFTRNWSATAQLLLIADPLGSIIKRPAMFSTAWEFYCHRLSKNTQTWFALFQLCNISVQALHFSRRQPGHTACQTYC